MPATQLILVFQIFSPEMKSQRLGRSGLARPHGWVHCAVITFFLLTGWASAAINAQIQSVTGPTGTIASPRYVIDSDSENGNLGYVRNRVSVTSEVLFSHTGIDFNSNDFRLYAQLVDVATNEVVDLEVGTAATSPAQTVSMGVFSLPVTRTFTAYLDPGVDLGAGKSYLIRVSVQRWTQVTLPNGQKISLWFSVEGPDDSTSFVVVHFMDLNPGNDAFVRGYPTAGASWTKSYAVDTDSAKKSFTVSVPYFMSRYDLGGLTGLISFRLTATLVDSNGTNVPLKSGGRSYRSLFMSPGRIGLAYRPATLTGSFTASFAPAGQLDSRNGSYRVKVKIEHLETFSPNTYHDDGSTGLAAARRLLHFNGNLVFGSTETQIDSLQNDPAAISLGTGYVNTLLQVDQGSVPSHAGYSYGSGALLGVRLMSNGDAVVQSGSELVQGGVSADFSGVKVNYPDTHLKASGPVAGNVIVELPQGLGYTANRSGAAGRYSAAFDMGAGTALNADFRHAGTLSAGVGGDAWVFDESRPLLYEVSSFDFTQDGEIRFQTAKVEWAQEEAFDRLDSNQATGLHENPTMAYRMTNDGYLRFARIPNAQKVDFVAASDGTARTNVAEMVVKPGSFRSHFPRDSEFRWDDEGVLNLKFGVPEPSSVLEDAQKVAVAYDGSCENDPCGPAAGAVDEINASPVAGHYYITPDGGLYSGVGFSDRELKWGYRGDGGGGVGPYTHRTDKFGFGQVLMPGYQTYASANPLGASAVFSAVAGKLAPGVLLLAGFDEGSPDQMVYAETDAYRDGAGAYAGLTMTVSEDEATGASRIADMVNDYGYGLQREVSKYYLRPSGISGRHVAREKSFSSEATLYKYGFQITRFQLTYLSNENKDSWINGGIAVPQPSDFKQRFLGLRLSCTGALESAEIDPEDSGAKGLRYWHGEFTPVTMRFAPQNNGGCYGDRFLTMGLISGAANIPAPLAGTLAFMPSGDIGTIADDIVGVDGRLGLPGRIMMDGPGDEQYELYPVSKLYFNNANASGAPETGFVSFAATCGVPFFQDLKVHCMTSAQANVPSALYLASGWSEGGQTFYSSDQFDPNHRGFPATGTTVSNYQNPNSKTAFVVHAEQSIFGLVPLDYPLKWNPSSRFFTTWEAENDDLLVVKVDHQIDYLSAENAELSFGVQYEGLPQINLVNTAYGAVEERIGAAQALTEAASEFVTDTLNKGVDEIGGLVSDTMESVLDEAVDAIEEDVINPLYDAVITSYNDAVAANDNYNDWVDGSSGDLKTVFDRYLDGSIGVAADSIKGRLNNLADAATSASNLVTRVDDAVVRGIVAIDSVTSEIRTFRNASGDVVVDLTAPPGYSPDQVISGILQEVAGAGGELERQIVQALVKSLIAKLAPEDLAAVLNPLLSDLSSDLNAQLNELLAEFDPTLDRVTEVLLEARGYLVDIRSKLAAGQELITNFQQIITNASTEIDAIVAQIRQTAYGFIDQIAEGATYLPNTVLGEAGNLIEEFDKDEFVAMIRAELRDRLLAADFIQQIQYTLRQYISELDLAMKSAIDSAFGEVSRMCKELIKEALGPIDDAINELVGDVNKFVGAGSIDGYAHIQGDTLRKLRLDAEVEFKIPEKMTLQAYFEMNCFDAGSDVGSSACLSPGEQAVEVKIGALDVPLDWVSPDVRADLEVRFSMQTAPSVYPKGIGGGLVMTSGEIDFQGMTITAFGAGVGVGLDECYLAATARVIVSDYEAAGGIFFGRTCSIEPLELVDPEVASLLGAPPFTGAYVYGEVWIPISEVILGIPASCLFRISAGVGAGAFYFVEGPTYGGKMLLGVSGEALCIVSIKGDVSMIGVMNNGSLRFKGKGRLTGKAGACPFCVKFKESAEVTYQDGSWSVDF